MEDNRRMDEKSNFKDAWLTLLATFTHQTTCMCVSVYAW